MVRKGLGIAAVLALAACGQAGTSGDDWPDYDGPGTDHFSPLTEIDESNVADLGLAWHHNIDIGGSSMTAPIAVGGVLYFAGGATHIHALDGASGTLLWEHDSGAREKAGEKLRGAWGSRGLAYANGKLFAGTLDGRLIALDAKTGKELWSAMTVEPGDGRYVTGAPLVYGDTVVIGHGGADYRPVRGYVTAYSQKTGRQLWRFWTVPGDPARGFENKAMEMAAKTWSGEWWRHGGGGTVWNSMVYDPKFNRVYLGVGNGAPWNQKIRSPGGGDNLFLCAIVALDADTGEYVWHLQQNPGETWDFNSAMDIELAELEIAGKPRDVILHAPKNGFFYVIDRATGKLVSAKDYVPVTWAKGIDQKTGRPIENPEARFPDGKPVAVYPSYFGSHNVEAMAFSPQSGLVYFPALDQGRVYADPPGDLTKWRHKEGMRSSNGVDSTPAVPTRKPTSFLLAWDPVRQREAWRVPMTGPRGGGGVAATAGNLVFQGNIDGQFAAYVADSGRKLWSFAAQTGIMAQPISYRAGGKQYVAVVSGARFGTAQGLPQGEWDYRTQQWRVLAFALGGKDKLPAPTPVDRTIPDDPKFVISAGMAKRGGEVFNDYCAGCHGGNAMAGGTGPNLLTSAVPLDGGTFASIVRDGALVTRGMPAYPEISVADAEAMRHFLRQQARGMARK